MSKSIIEKNKRNKSIWIILSVFILISVGIGIFLLNKEGYIISNGNLSGVIVKDGVIPGYTQEEIEEILQRKADESMFSFEINARPTFKDGKSEGNLRIANPPYNAYAISVEIKLDSDNRTIFKSKKLNPNQYIENAKLTKRLNKGQYEATATISAYDQNTKELKGKSVAKLIINVEN